MESISLLDFEEVLKVLIIFEKEDEKEQWVKVRSQYYHEEEEGLGKDRSISLLYF
jgi:hypothetical protein